MDFRFRVIAVIIRLCNCILLELQRFGKKNFDGSNGTLWCVTITDSNEILANQCANGFMVV